MPRGVLSVVKSGKESEFEWTINHFSLSKDLYISPCLKFEGESWCLQLHPNCADRYMEVRLWRLSNGSPTEVEFSVSLKTTEGKKSFERRGRKSFEEIYSACNIHEWINRSEFSNRQREFLSSGCLTILITMKKARCEKETQSESSTSQTSGSQTKDKTAQDWKKLNFNHENCDVVFRVQGQEFSAHQTILAARSPVFASLFRSNMKETVTGKLDIEDVDPNCFSDFLRFMYCGEIENFSFENVRSLFTAADKYDITDLRTMCLELMKEKLSDEISLRKMYLDSFQR